MSGRSLFWSNSTLPLSYLLTLKKPKYETSSSLKEVSISFSDKTHMLINNITNVILTNSKLCVPNKYTTVRPSEPPWIISHLKLLIRRRCRSYRKAIKHEVSLELFKKLLIFCEIENNLTLVYLSDLFPPSAKNENYLLRNRMPIAYRELELHFTKNLISL